MTFDIDTPDLTAERLGNTNTVGVWHFDSGLAGPSVLITALMHGNELCGAWALKELLAKQTRPAKGKLTLAFCNLDAFDRFDRNAHDGSRLVDEDLNRVWTDERLANPRTNESRRAQQLRPWVEQADYLLDIHSMHEPAPPLLVTGLLQRNIDFGLSLGLPRHIIVDGGHKNGTRMRDFAQFGEESGKALALLIECGFHGHPSAIRVAREVTGRLLLKSGIMQSDALPGGWDAGHEETNQQVFRVTEAVAATSKNVTFTQPWQGMECIEKAGTVIGHDDGMPIETPYDNCFLVMPSLRQLIPGVSVTRFARRIH